MDSCFNTYLWLFSLWLWRLNKYIQMICCVCWSSFFSVVFRFLSNVLLFSFTPSSDLPEKNCNHNCHFSAWKLCNFQSAVFFDYCSISKLLIIDYVQMLLLMTLDRYWTTKVFSVGSADNILCRYKHFVSYIYINFVSDEVSWSLTYLVGTSMAISETK